MAKLIDITDLTDAALDVVLAVRCGEDFVDCGHLTAAERGQVVVALGVELNARTRAWVAGPPPVRADTAPGRDVEGLILAEQDARFED
jgi:hypothetical protein